MNKENTPTSEQISEFNRHIKDGIRQWSDMCLTFDADNVSKQFNYDKHDLVGATLIFQHVFYNIGIKNGLIASEETGDMVGNTMHDFIEKFTGIDMRKIYED